MPLPAAQWRVLNAVATDQGRSVWWLLNKLGEVTNDDLLALEQSGLLVFGNAGQLVSYGDMVRGLVPLPATLTIRATLTQGGQQRVFSAQNMVLRTLARTPRGCRVRDVKRASEVHDDDLRELEDVRHIIALDADGAREVGLPKRGAVPDDLVLKLTPLGRTYVDAAV